MKQHRRINQGPIGDDRFFKPPLVREMRRLIEANAFIGGGLRSKVIITFPFEDIWVRQVKGFFQHDAFIPPAVTIGASGQSDDAAIHTQHLEK